MSFIELINESKNRDTYKVPWWTKQDTANSVREKGQVQGRRSSGHRGVSLIKDFKKTVLIFISLACQKFLAQSRCLKMFLN